MCAVSCFCAAKLVRPDVMREKIVIGINEMVRMAVFRDERAYLGMFDK